MDVLPLNEVVRSLPLPTLVSGAAALTVLALIVGRLLGNTLTFGKPPVYEGIPYIGGLIRFAKGPLELMEGGYKALGEVFTVPVLHKNITFLIGPHASPHFFKAPDDEVSQYEVYKYSVPLFGRRVVFDVDHKVRAEQFRFFAEALKTQRMAGYVPTFVLEAQDFFRKWGNEGVVNLKEELSELIILTASRALLGREIRESMFSEVKDLLIDLDNGVQPISVFLPYLPTAAHATRDRARKALGEIFSKAIQQRRARNEAGERDVDVLQSFIDARYKTVYNGRATDDEEITGMLISALYAGQHTSAVTSSWTGYLMLDDKDKSWQAAFKEQQEIVAQYGPELNMEVLNKMDVLHRCIQEALRMHPPLIMMLRYVRKAFTVSDSKGKDYLIPKGQIVATSPLFSHRLPHVFAEPMKYDPERYAAPREEDKALPFSYIGFGGGRHGCMGQNYAYLQIKTLMAIMLRQFDLELVDPVPEPNYAAMVVGPKSARVRYVRRKSPLPVA